MMTIPSPYFKNVPGLGDLRMEQIIVDYVYPLLSVLQDNLGRRYLCMCFDTRGAQQWLITSISDRVLASLLKNEITLSFPFEDSGTKKFKVIMDYRTRKETFQLLNSNQIPREDLPDAGEYLDAEPGEWTEYIKMLSFTSTKNFIPNGMIHYCANGRYSVRWKDSRQQSGKSGRYVSCAARY